MARPVNIMDSLRELSVLADDICHLAGDRSVDSSWYTKRASLSIIYSSSELFMTNDVSPGFRDTRDFLHRKLEEAEYSEGIISGVGHWIGFTANSGVNILRSKGVRM